jgi:hypothetical protein
MALAASLCSAVSTSTRSKAAPVSIVLLAVQDEVLHEVRLASARLARESRGVHAPPAAIVTCSAATGDGVPDLLVAVRRALSELDDLARGEDTEGEDAAALRGVHDWGASPLDT